MKFYLASSFDLKQQVVSVATSLKARGHSITVEWWHYDYKQRDIPDASWFVESEVVDVSNRNFQGIEDCDRFVLIADSETPRKFNGANIELGYALALQKPCYSLGKLERSAMYVPVIRCDSLDDILGEADK